MAEGTDGPRLPQRVLVVVPAWNEESNLAQVLAALRLNDAGEDVLVFDDGSSDGTAAVADEAGAAVIRLPFNVGVGGAMRAGFLYAVRKGYDGVVQVDADGQHDPAQVDRLVAGLATADVVIGSRFADGGAYPVRGPRRWAMRLLAWSLSRLSRTRLSDVTSGFRATGPRAVGLLSRLYPAEYLGDTVESLVILRKARLSVREVSVTMSPRAAGLPSQSGVAATLYLGRALLVLVLSLLRSHPAARAAGAKR